MPYFISFDPWTFEEVRMMFCAFCGIHPMPSAPSPQNYRMFIMFISVVCHVEPSPIFSRVLLQNWEAPKGIIRSYQFTTPFVIQLWSRMMPLGITRSQENSTTHTHDGFHGLKYGSKPMAHWPIWHHFFFVLLHVMLRLLGMVQSSFFLTPNRRGNTCQSRWFFITCYKHINFLWHCLYITSYNMFVDWYHLF